MAASHCKQDAMSVCAWTDAHLIAWLQLLSEVVSPLGALLHMLCHFLAGLHTDVEIVGNLGDVTHVPRPQWWPLNPEGGQTPSVHVDSIQHAQTGCMLCPR